MPEPIALRAVGLYRALDPLWTGAITADSLARLEPRDQDAVLLVLREVMKKRKKIQDGN